MRISLPIRWACAALLAAAGVVGLPSAASAAPQTPACAWEIESRPPQSNAAMPDTNATYWLMSYTVQPGLRIVLDGQFPDARYTSLTSYDSGRNLFEVNGVSSGLSDYQIAPDAGSGNPWQQAGPAGGGYTVTLKQDVTAGETNVVPLAPADAPAGATGYLILRVYLPAGGPSAVTLPGVTFVRDGVSVVVPPCPRTAVAATSAPTTPRLPAVTLRADGRTVDFVRAFTSNLGGFPSSANGYLGAALIPPVGNRVVVIRGKAATTPSGPHPAPWPSSTAQLRYWSMCTNLAQFPLPVVVNQLPDGSTDPGCRADDVTTLDGAGYYTYVVGTEGQRAQIEAIPGVTFVPFSLESPRRSHVLLLRNMLGDGFARSIQQVPDTTAASARQAMGEYYPEAAVCALATAVANPASCLPAN